MGRKLRTGDGRPHLGMAANTWGWPPTPGGGHSHLGMANLHLGMATHTWRWRVCTWGRPRTHGDGGVSCGNGPKKRTTTRNTNIFHLKKRDRPTEQPSNRATNQPTNQPTNQQTNQPTNKPTNQQTVNGQTSKQTNRPICQPTSRTSQLTSHPPTSQLPIQVRKKHSMPESAS